MTLQVIQHQNKLTPIVLAIAVLVCIIGAFAGTKLPNALLPPIDRPEILVFTNWPGKSAQEIEQTLIAPLENTLSGLSNNTLIESNISNSTASTRLVFKANTDMNEAYMQTLTSISQVPNWPANVAPPFVLNQANGAGVTMATAMLYSQQPTSKQAYIDTFKNIVYPALIKIDGVASIATASNPIGQRIDIEVDMNKLAQLQIPLSTLSAPLRLLADRSGSTLKLGDREYELHFEGQLNQNALSNLAIYSTESHIVRLQDVATVTLRVEQDWGFSSMHGNRAFYFRLNPSNDVNALATVSKIKSTIKTLNQGPLSTHSMTLALSRDDSKAIHSAIEQVYIALLIGVLLSTAILFYFFRNLKTVSLVFVSIPVCLASVLLAMFTFDYSLNVISLAAMALSVGLLLDAAIVVVERIEHKIQQAPNESVVTNIASAVGEVKGAILSSTLSSIIIFVPILMISGPEAQLFEDLAFTISSALFASLLVALILIPVLARYVLIKPTLKLVKSAERGTRLLTLSTRNISLKVTTLILGIPVALLCVYFASPPLDVLPAPKSKVALAYISYSDPLSAHAVEKHIAMPILDRIAAQKTNPDAPNYDVTGMFCFPSGCLLYFYPPEDWDYQVFKHWISTKLTHDIAGTRTFINQGNLLSFALPNNRQTQLDLQGAALEVLQAQGKSLLKKLQKQFPDANIASQTELNNQTARIAFTPKYEQLVRYGINNGFLTQQLQLLSQGVYLGQFASEGENLPFYLKSQQNQDLEHMLATQVVIPNFGLIPLSELVDATFTLAPSSLLRVNQQTSITLNLSPPEGQTVAEFYTQVSEYVQTLQKTTEFSALSIKVRGSADNLSQFLNEFLNMFSLSMVILVFLLWLALSSWKLTFAVIASMPLALAGGMLCLQLLNLFSIQNLDMITLIGFIILMGLVINNAILLANKFQDNLTQGDSQQVAILNAVSARKRAIYMSTGTSIFGMLPLMLSPGEGAEIYRGLAAVIIGGMTFSALFSLSFMAALLSLPLFEPKTKAIQLTVTA
ncbi:Efflux pump membrane transporter BepE [Pseudoalteromonas holothuriae]|uniref:Efflux pump membrane transporter BepE n=1 Tax=Pseudoalteromonas holothuriae TaxID=2963714 RepID=A0ABM9GGE7_9GAMM|nr:efflux RND transporter permease subunit [Pseudoalteromonas sp. CIP111951]CAH9055991.1 Efflux pump membrane transporter BepE [Pseudoalteromonas sp. CIP111951]